MNPEYFQPFKKDISAVALPEKFTFPFYYTPHPLAEMAAEALQDYLKTQTDFTHNFGLDKNQLGLVIGKMFGVLVCQKQDGSLGYLWAFSGKLADSNHHTLFVPPVFDMLQKDSFFKKEEKKLNHINAQIAALESSKEYLEAQQHLKNMEAEAATDLQKQKQRIKTLKQLRDKRRKEATNFKDQNVLTALEATLSEESKKESMLLKKMTKYWNYQKAAAAKELETYSREIEQLKTLRKQKSGQVQQQLFQNYSFLNVWGASKSIGEIFNGNPPAGAGECAAPKLLHYAFKENLKPIA